MQAKTAASPLLQAAGKLASVETKKVLRRLHVTGAQDRREKRRETAPFARLLAKASHTNPLAVCSVLIGQVLLLDDLMMQCWMARRSKLALGFISQALDEAQHPHDATACQWADSLLAQVSRRCEA